MTPLDLAHKAMEDSPDDVQVRLRFYEVLASVDLQVLLKSAPEPGSVHLQPMIADTADGRIVLAFDTLDRMADFLEQPASHAEVPGHELLQMLAGRDLSLGLNFGVAPSSTLLPPGGIAWAAAEICEPVTAETVQPQEILPPSLDDVRIMALESRVAAMAGTVESAWLARLRNTDGRSSHALAVIGVEASTQARVAEAIATTHRLSGPAGQPLDILFLEKGEAMQVAFAQHGLPFDIPSLTDLTATMPRAPGTDPDKPPKLK